MKIPTHKEVRSSFPRVSISKTKEIKVLYELRAMKRKDHSVRDETEYNLNRGLCLYDLLKKELIKRIPNIKGQIIMGLSIKFKLHKKLDDKFKREYSNGTEVWIKEGNFKLYPLTYIIFFKP